MIKNKGVKIIAGIVVTFFFSSTAFATPSTTFWAPSTPYLQPFGVLHITYDTYFLNDYDFSTDVGLTMGLLPLKEIQLEAGFDFLFPSPFIDSSGKKVFPLLLNAKLGTPEDTFFNGQPGWSFGIFNMGFENGINNYNILHFMLGKTMREDWGFLKYLGTIQVGLYYGLEKTLFESSDGEINQFGIMAGWFSYPIDIPVIDKIILTADVMTGRNAVGAGGGGIYLYITPTISLLSGPVIFFDSQKAGAPQGWIWTLQLDVDIDLKPSESQK